MNWPLFQPPLSPEDQTPIWPRFIRRLLWSVAFLFLVSILAFGIQFVPFDGPCDCIRLP